jgi:hypothetical protein
MNSQQPFPQISQIKYITDLTALDSKIRCLLIILRKLAFNICEICEFNLCDLWERLFAAPLSVAPPAGIKSLYIVHP